jgi:Winged helix domain, variant
MMDPDLETETKSRLRRQSKRKDQQLARSLADYRFRGPLGEVMRAFKLESVHFQVLTVLLHRQMRSEDPAMEGRLILATLFQTPFDILANLNLLHATSPLRAAGLIRMEDREEASEDLLEARFRLSNRALEAFRGEVAGLAPAHLRRVRQTGYSHHRQFLVDLRVLHNLYRHRSALVFNQDRWDRLHTRAPSPLRHLDQRIQRFWKKIRRRLEGTEGAAAFPAVQFLRKHALSDSEMMIVVHLLFQELYDGNAYADVVELLRLVSSGEDDLLRNRSLVHRAGPLVKHGILAVETMLEGRELTGEARLNDWVVNAVFGVAIRDEAIQSDERINWHSYLKDMRGTEGFFEDLEAS